MREVHTEFQFLFHDKTLDCPGLLYFRLLWIYQNSSAFNWACFAQRSFLFFHCIPATESLKQVPHSLLDFTFLEESVSPVSGTRAYLFTGVPANPVHWAGCLFTLAQDGVSPTSVLDTLLIWISQGPLFLRLDRNDCPGPSLGPETLESRAPGVHQWFSCPPCGPTAAGKLPSSSGPSLRVRP